MKCKQLNPRSWLNQDSETVQQFVSALQKKDLDQVRTLLSTHNINQALNKVDSDTSVLTYIIRNEDEVLEEVMSWLLPSVQVVITGSCGMQSFLRGNLAVNCKDWGGNFPIYEAVRMGSMNSVTTLLKYGADVFVKNSQGLTPLHMAATAETEQVSALVNFEMHNLYKGHGKINTLAEETQGESESGNSPKLSKPDSIEVPTENQADISCSKKKYVNLADPWGNTALIRAAAYNQVECAKVLLDNGADVNAKNEDGITALHLAIITGNTALSSVLIDKGARVDFEIANFNRRLAHCKRKSKYRRGKFSKMWKALRRFFKKEMPFIDIPPIVVFASIQPTAFEMCRTVSANPDHLRKYGLEHLFLFMKQVHTRNYGGFSCPTIYPISGLYVIPVCSVSEKCIEDVVKYHILQGSDVDHALMNLSFRDWLFRDNHKNTLQLCLRACSFSPSVWSESSLQSIYDDAVTMNAEARVKPLLEASHKFYENLFFDHTPAETKSQDDATVNEKAVQTEVFSPRSLRELCRMQIRHALACNVLYKAQALPLPLAMKQCICIEPDNDSTH